MRNSIAPAIEYTPGIRDVRSVGGWHGAAHAYIADPDSLDGNAWESTLKGFKKDKEPQTPLSGVGERAYLLYPKPDNESQGNVAFLVAKSGNHTLALSLDAPKGRSADSMRPALESLMKTVLARLP